MGPLRRVKLTELNAHLVCVLCSGYFVDATTIIECLHTFCKTCIVRYLQTSSFCPICDVQVHKTKPLLSLREDRTLQDVVFKLVPDLFHSEMNRRLCFYKEHPEAGGDKTEQSLRERRHFFHVDDQISLSLEYLPSASNSSSHLHNIKPLKVSNGQQEKNKTAEEDKEGPWMKKEEESNNNNNNDNEKEEKIPSKIIHKRYLKCPAAVQVSHLEKFIRLKYSLPAHTHKVDIMHGGDCLIGELTLLDVVYMYKWTEDAPLRLMYTVSAIPQTRKRTRPNGLRTTAVTDPEAPAPKIPKTGQSSLPQQPPTHHLSHSQVHSVPGRDQDSVGCATNASETPVCSVEEKVEVSEPNPVVSVSLAVTTINSVSSNIGGVSSVSINIPSLPNTILNSGIAQLPTPLASGRRTAFTKTTPATSTPRLAVPIKSYTEGVSPVTPLEGVSASVQVTTPIVTLTSSVAVSFPTTSISTSSLNTTNISNPINTGNSVNVLPVSSVPVTAISNPVVNGVDSSQNVNSTISQPNKILQPIIPTKPRLGRPPNSSRVSSASLKPSGTRGVDVRSVRPVTLGKVANKINAPLNRMSPVVSATLNVQNRLSSISGQRMGNPKVSIKRLSDVSKAGTNENIKTVPSPSTSLNTESQLLVSSANSTPNQQSSNGGVSQPKSVMPSQVSDYSGSVKSQNIPIPNQKPFVQDSHPGVSSTQWAVPNTTAPSKIQKPSIVQNQQFQGNQIVKSTLQSSSVPASHPITTVAASTYTSIHSEQGTMSVNSKFSHNPITKVPISTQAGIRSALPNQGAAGSTITAVASNAVSIPSSVSNGSQSFPNNKLNQAAPLKAPSPSPVSQKIVTTTANRTPVHTPNRISPGPPQRTPAPLRTPSPATRRPVSNTTPYRPLSSQAPHRASSSPAQLRTPSPAPHRAPSPAPHRAPPSPAPHRAPPSPAPHRAPPSPAPHRAPPSPAPHRAPPSPAPHRAPPSPAPHRAPPSPAPHRAPPSPAPHRAPPSPAPHRAPPSPAPHRAPPSPAPHRAPPSPAPHRAPPSPAPHREPPSSAPHKAPPSPAPHRASPSPGSQPPQSPSPAQPPSPAAYQAPASPAATAPSSVSQQGQTKPNLSTAKTNGKGNVQTTLNQSGVAVNTDVMNSAVSLPQPVVSNVAAVNKGNVSNGAIAASASTTCASTLVSTNTSVSSSDVKTAAKVSPGLKTAPKSPGRKKGNGGSPSSILSIAQNLANRQLQQRTVTSTPLSSTATSSVAPTTQANSQQPYTTTPNTMVYPNSGLVNPALAAAYMASAYGGDASTIENVAAMRNLITLSQTAACLRELNLAAMVHAAETLPRSTDPTPIDLSPTSKAAPQTPLTNGRSPSVATTAPITSNSKTVKSAQTKCAVVSVSNAPTISPPTPEVTITKLPSTPATSVATNPTVTNTGKNVPGLVKLASSSTNTVSITKRPASSNRIAVAKSPANASIRQIPNPSLLRHQSEVRNNNNVSKSTTVSSASTKGSSTTVSSKAQQSPKLNSSNRSTGNSPLKDTGPLPETSSILKIENLTRSLAPAATAAAASSQSLRFFDNR